MLKKKKQIKYSELLIRRKEEGEEEGGKKRRGKRRRKKRRRRGSGRGRASVWGGARQDPEESREDCEAMYQSITISKDFKTGRADIPCEVWTHYYDVNSHSISGKPSASLLSHQCLCVNIFVVLIGFHFVLFCCF